MGNTASAGKRVQEAMAFGNVFIQLDDDAYTWNQTLTGVIHVNILKHYPGDKLCFKLKGKEFAKWIDHETHQVHGKPETRTVTRKEKHEFLKSEMTVYDWQRNAILAPGQYSFPFAFVIPSDIPNSFFYGHNTQVGEIRYTIEASIVPEDNVSPKLKFKREITVKEPARPITINKKVTIKQAVKTGCCCSDQGNVNVTTYFEKDGYAPSEQAKIMTEIDNSDCQVNLSSISFKLAQTITLKAHGHTKNFHYDSSSMNLGSVKAGQSFVGDKKKLASLQLPPAQPGSSKEFKANDNYRMHFDPKETLGPSTNGNLVKSEYQLEVICNVDGCLCCGSEPETSIPVQIYPVSRKTITNPPLPANWNPTAMPTLNITVNGVAPTNNPTPQVNTNIQTPNPYNPGMYSSNMPQTQPQQQYQQYQQYQSYQPSNSGFTTGQNAGPNFGSTTGPSFGNTGSQYSQNQPNLYNSRI